MYAIFFWIITGYIIEKGRIVQGDIAIINTYIPNDIGSKYMKQHLIGLQEVNIKARIIVSDFNIPLSEIAISNRTKISQ